MNPLLEIVYNWKSISGGQTNFYTLEQTAYARLNGSQLVQLDNFCTKFGDSIEDWKFENIKDWTTIPDLVECNWSFVKDNMEWALNESEMRYKYCLVKFANGREYICTSFDELLSYTGVIPAFEVQVH